MKETTKNIQQNSPAQGNPGKNQIQADAPTVNDGKAAVGGDLLQQGAAGRELSPEYGDAADPASEELAQHHRDE